MNATADATVKCATCGSPVMGVDDNGRLLDASGAALHSDGTPHDTRLKDSGIAGNVDLGWFTLREYELNEIMRDVAYAEDVDPDDPASDAYLPMPTIGSAWESWLVSSDEERVTYLRVGSDVPALFVMDRIAQAERDLAFALHTYGPDEALDNVFRCPMGLTSAA